MLNVDCDNQFFINLFKKQINVFRPKRCLRCNEILLNHHSKVKHDFLVHYGVCRDTYEEKPVSFVRIGEIQKYEITFGRCQMLETRFLVVAVVVGEVAVLAVCGFSIENKQLSLFAANASDVILNLRYCSTEPFQTK